VEICNSLFIWPDRSSHLRDATGIGHDRPSVFAGTILQEPSGSICTTDWSTLLKQSCNNLATLFRPRRRSDVNAHPSNFYRPFTVATCRVTLRSRELLLWLGRRISLSFALNIKQNKSFTIFDFVDSRPTPLSRAKRKPRIIRTIKRDQLSIINPSTCQLHHSQLVKHHEFPSLQRNPSLRVSATHPWSPLRLPGLDRTRGRPAL
jgi:hypothetical protein